MDIIKVEPASRLALITEYDGTNYNGFQFQNNAPSVQERLENAIFKFTKEQVRIRGASRTDTGVHAKGQVVDFLTSAQYSPEIWTKALNFYLPNDIKVKSSYSVDLSFHSRKDALSRTYVYTIFNESTPSPLLRRQSDWVISELNIEAMWKSSRALIGLHDVSQFSLPLPVGRSAVRSIKKWDVERIGNLVYIEAQASGFLQHQILNTNGLLVKIGKELESTTVVDEILRGSIIRMPRWVPLKAQGLCLQSVEYSDFPPKEIGAK